MKKITQYIFLVLLFVTAGCRHAKTHVSDNNQAEIKFPETSYDYGRIPEGSPGISSFDFTNISEVPLVINRVRTSCGCAVPDWPKDPIKPGESGTIKVNYNTKIPGTFRKTITIYANAKNSPVNLFISGEVVAEN